MTEASQAKGFNAALKIMSQLGDMIEEVWQNGYKQGMSEQRTFIENKQLN